MTETIGDALPKEMARVRDLIPLYQSIPTGGFAVFMMKNDLDRAAKALAECDVAEMYSVYQDLQEYHE